MRLHPSFSFWLSSFIGRQGERSFRCPSQSYSHVDSASLEAGNFRPLRNSKVLALKFNPPSTSFVDRLLRSRGPNTVFWRIAFVIINAFKAAPIRWIAHILVELHKIYPSVTDRNSPFAIVVIGRMKRIAAPCDHRCPCFIGSTVRKTVGRYPFPIVAPTTLGAFLRARYILPRGIRETPTVALATPKQRPITAIRVVVSADAFQDNKTIKSLPGNIGTRLKFVRKLFWGKIDFRHRVSSINLMLEAAQTFSRLSASNCVLSIA